MPSYGLTVPRSASRVAGPGAVVVHAYERDHSLRVGGTIHLAPDPARVGQRRVDLGLPGRYQPVAKLPGER